MRGLCQLSLLCAACLTAIPAANALNATEIFAKTRDAIFMVIVTADEPGVVDVVSQGSAVLIAPGRFVTNCHVLEKGKRFVVSRREDRIVERVLLVTYLKGRDLCELDLAEPKPGFDKPVEVAPDDSLLVGANVFAIGSPRGMEMTISNGIVSGFREANGGMKLIQTTAPISPGSSGGGLFDEQGRLVGITSMVARNAQNLNFALPASLIPSARITAAELARQRSGSVRTDNIVALESAFERQERMRRQEQDTIAARKKQLDQMMLPGSDPSAPGNGPALRPASPRKPVATRLAPYQSSGDDALPARMYDQLAKKGLLAGVDDDLAIRKVYEALIRQQIASEMRWSEGGGHVAEFRIQLRRSGDVMFVIPVKPSGIERFDQEAQRAIGAASPLLVPQDNDAFAQMSEITIDVRAPERGARAAPATPPAAKKPR